MEARRAMTEAATPRLKAGKKFTSFGYKTIFGHMTVPGLVARQTKYHQSLFDIITASFPIKTSTGKVYSRDEPSH